MFKKTTIVLLPALLVVQLATIRTSAADLLPRSELVTVGAEAIFAPPGFDDNDNAQLVVHGKLINTCYVVAPPKVNVDLPGKMIVVTPRAYVRFSSWCLNMLVPFTQTIDLGLLPPGTYKVFEENAGGKRTLKGTLPVAVTEGGGTDDTLYAPVSNALVKNLEGGKRELVLSGIFPSDCLYIDQVKVLQRMTGVVEVLPLAGYKQGVICQGTPHPFEVRTSLPDATAGISTLIHVRSLNGQSVNQVEE